MKLMSGEGEDLTVDDAELGTLLDEIHATSPHQHQHPLQYNPSHVRLLSQHAQSGHVVHGHGNASSRRQAIFGVMDDDPSSYLGYQYASPVIGVSIQSSGRLSPDASSSPSPPPAIEYPTPLRTQYPDGGFQSQQDDKLCLSDKFSKINIRDDVAKFNDWPVGDQMQRNGNVVMKGFNGLSSVYDQFAQAGALGFLSSDEEMRKNLVGMQQQHQQSPQHRQVGNLSMSRSILPSQLANNPSYSGQYMEVMNDPWNQSNEFLNHASLSSLHEFSEDPFGGNFCSSGVYVPDMSNSVNGSAVGQNGIDFSRRDMCGLDPSRLSSYASLPKTPPYRTPIISNSLSPQPSLIRRVSGLEAFTCEGNLIIQGKDLNYGVNVGWDIPRERQDWQNDRICNAPLIGKNYGLDSRLQNLGVPTGLRSPSLQPMCIPLAQLKGNIYLLAKDQHGCRFLQQKFDEGNSQDVHIIFNEIIDYIVELMMNSFGNYLIQKLLDVCTERQRMQILIVVTRKRSELVKISLNTHGTRAVQKLIETLTTQEQISLVISALEPGFIALIKDLNGNHVLQKCLQCFSVEDNKFIFDAATKYCVDVATHRHGCCVLQRCISHSSGEHRDNLVAEISSNGFLLAQDPFGNYVVQFILEQIPSAAMNLASQFEGNYVVLSMQKFSSNVVEKCLKFFDEDNQSRIIHELLSMPHFDCLLQDPYANYVVYSALTVSKGPLHASLVERIRPHAADLRTNPYCKRIFSKAILKR